ncbi:response regulator [Desulfovulcanus sp.]
MGSKEKDGIKAQKGEGVGLSNIRVLVADDNQENLELMKDVLNILRVQEVSCVTNGQEVLDLIDRDKKRFDVLILDLEMPGVDGLTCAQKLRQKGIDIPIIAMTGHAFETYKKKCFKNGMDYFLTKPFNIEELQDVLAKIVDRKTRKDSGT